MRSREHTSTFSPGSLGLSIALHSARMDAHSQAAVAERFIYGMPSREHTSGCSPRNRGLSIASHSARMDVRWPVGVGERFVCGMSLPTPTSGHSPDILMMSIASRLARMGTHSLVEVWMARCAYGKSPLQVTNALSDARLTVQMQ